MKKQTARPLSYKSTNSTAAWIYKKQKKRKVVGSQPGLPGSTGFCRVNSPAGFYFYPDQSQAQVDPPGRFGFQNDGASYLQQKKWAFSLKKRQQGKFYPYGLYK